MKQVWVCVWFLRTLNRYQILGIFWLVFNISMLALCWNLGTYVNDES